MRSDAPSFERLEKSVTIIARHADYPGKNDVVAECLNDVERRWRRGELTSEQRLRLVVILERSSSTHRLLMTAPELDQMPREETPKFVPGRV
jgi:hypothetical protein